MAFAFDLHQWGGRDGGGDWNLFSKMAANGRLGTDRATRGGFSLEHPHAIKSGAARRKTRGGVDFLGAVTLASGDDRWDLCDLRETQTTRATRFLNVLELFA